MPYIGQHRYSYFRLIGSFVPCPYSTQVYSDVFISVLNRCPGDQTDNRLGIRVERVQFIINFLTFLGELLKLRCNQANNIILYTIRFNDFSYGTVARV